MSAEETGSGAGASGEASAADLVAAAFDLPQAEAARQIGSARAQAAAEDEAEAEVMTHAEGGAGRLDGEAVTETVTGVVEVTEVTEISGLAEATEAVTLTETVTETVTTVETVETVVANDTTAAHAETLVAAAVPHPGAAAQAGESGPFAQPDPAQPSQGGVPHLDPAAFFSMLSATEAEAAAAAKPKRRVLRLVGRYSLVLLTVGAIGAGTAYAVTLPKRTDIPTLKTKNDGRYVFPGLAKPAPPAGSLAPADPANSFHRHGGDLRRYLLPVPQGATADPKYPAAGGWVDAEAFADRYDTSTVVKTLLSDDGVRDIAARAWTAPDGQRTTVTLLQFPDEDAAADFVVRIPDVTVIGLEGESDKPGRATVRDLVNGTRQVDVNEYATVTVPVIPDGASSEGVAARYAFWQTGDVVAVVTTSGPTKVTDVPTIQVIELQAEMLV